MLFTDKYKPSKISEIQGQDAAIAKLKQAIQKNKSSLVYGPVGCGKTSSVYVIANELNYEILEINASNFRNKKNIEGILGQAIKQKSLFYENKIILVDELEGIAGREDYGGLSALAALIKITSYPLVIVANDPWAAKFSGLRKSLGLIEFEKLSYLSIFNILKIICDKEDIKYDDEYLKELAKRANGDARAAINDLQMLTQDKVLNKKDLELLDERETNENVFNVLKVIFKSKDIKLIFKTFNKLNIDLNEFNLWLDENIPKEYVKEDLAKAYDALSKADVFNGRIIRRQYYRFLVYRSMFLSTGVALAKKETYDGSTNYKRTSRILKIWIAKQQNLKRNAIAEKIAEKTHTSKKRVIKNDLPYMKIIIKKDKYIARELGLENEEVEWINKH
ncbi:MAG: replication factor C large subunit [Candidatus Woesearchaeota archaeon]|nr:replication factor C large subunit [Candidatus Woesearchaeota archaeon]